MALNNIELKQQILVTVPLKNKFKLSRILKRDPLLFIPF